MTPRRMRIVGLVVLSVSFTLNLVPAQTTEPVSVDPTSTTVGNAASCRPDFDFFGYRIVFESEASNLVPGDVNGKGDVFVRDLRTGVTRLVSVASDGTQGNRGSIGPAISASGRFVAFSSYATNLVPGDTNGEQDVFLHNLTTGETRRVSLSTLGEQPSEDCYNPTLDEPGRFVAYESLATNLVPDDRNHKVDVFVTDTWTGVTKRVSVGPGGTEGNDHSGAFPRTRYTARISHDGDRVVFPSLATNLVANDVNGVSDVFLHDTNTGVTTRISEVFGVGGNGPSLHADISHDGRWVAFVSSASNLVPGDVDDQPDVFVKELSTGVIQRVSLTSTGLRSSQRREIGPVRISGDARLVVFSVSAADLVPGDFNRVSDVVVHDRLTGATFRASVATDYGEANDWSDFPTISGNGRYLAFETMASNLVGFDVNVDLDVYVHGFGPEQWRNYGAGNPGTLGVPTMMVQGAPRLGQTFQILAGNAAGAPALGVLVFGFQFADLPLLGNQLLVQPDLPIAVVLPAPGLVVPIAVPVSPVLIRADAFVQLLHEDLGAPAGFAFSRGLEVNLL